MNYIEREIANKKKWTDAFGAITDLSGIYILRRVDEDGIKYAYVGQAKHILTRLGQHLDGYQHIDLSLKKHGFYSPDNKCGWFVDTFIFEIEELDELNMRLQARYDEIRKNEDIQIPADADLRGLQGGEGDQDRRRPCGCGRTRDAPSAAFRTLLLRHPPHRDGPLQDPEEVNEAIRRM